MANALSPVTQANIILDQGELDRLVEAAGEHHLIDCAFPDICPGDAVVHIVRHEMGPREVRRLLLLAVAELAVRRRG